MAKRGLVAVYPEQPEVRAAVGAGHQHVHLPQVRAAKGSPTRQGGTG